MVTVFSGSLADKLLYQPVPQPTVYIQVFTVIFWADFLWFPTANTVLFPTIGTILRATIPEESMIVRTALKAEVSSTTSISGSCSGPQTTPAILAYQPAEKICECAQSFYF